LKSRLQDSVAAETIPLIINALRKKDGGIGGCSKKTVPKSERFFDNRYNSQRILLPVNYQRIRALPQVSPPPKTGKHIKSSGWMLPSRTASSSAMAQEAEEILPYFWSVK
jgi:hypothetical protein